mgnify:CR=1 FL=1
MRRGGEGGLGVRVRRCVCILYAGDDSTGQCRMCTCCMQVLPAPLLCSSQPSRRSRPRLSLSMFWVTATAYIYVNTSTVLTTPHNQRVHLPVSCADIKWLGVRPSDLDRFNIPQQCRLPMTEEDMKTGRKLVSRAWPACASTQGVLGYMHAH